MKNNKTTKKYCMHCGAEKIKVEFETGYFDTETGKKEIGITFKCPNSKSCHDQEYCLAVGHKDKIKLFSCKCENCGLSIGSSLGCL